MKRAALPALVAVLILGACTKQAHTPASSATAAGATGGLSPDTVVATYADIQPGEICALFGSTDHLELAANSESAADRLQLGRGGVVSVNRR